KLIAIITLSTYGVIKSSEISFAIFQPVYKLHGVVVHQLFHVAFLWVSYHSLHLVPDTFFGESTGEFFTSSCLTAVENYQTTSGCPEFFNE
ncbi:GSCOCG00011437001-RA-CDS, partial [Cotesia congregata]